MKKKYIDGDLVRYTSLCKEPVAEICEVCETSYKDRGGKYQGQTGVTLPKT